MSEKQNKRTMTRPQFFRLCEEMRKKRDILMRERPSIPAAARQMAEWLGFHVSGQAVEEAQEATGVRWVVLKRCASGAEKQNRFRILCKAVVQLYRMFDQEVPADLVKVFASAEGKTEEQVERYFRNKSFSEQAKFGGTASTIYEPTPDNRD